MNVVQALDRFLDSESSTKDNTFVERFKYNVISSSLLSRSLPISTRIPGSPFWPGKFRRSHSRHTSLDSQALQPPEPTRSAPPYWSSATIVLLFSSGYHSLAVVLLGATLYYIYLYQSDTTKPDMTPVRFCAICFRTSANDPSSA